MGRGVGGVKGVTTARQAGGGLLRGTQGGACMCGSAARTPGPLARIATHLEAHGRQLQRAQLGPAVPEGAREAHAVLNRQWKRRCSRSPTSEHKGRPSPGQQLDHAVRVLEAAKHAQPGHVAAAEGREGEGGVEGRAELACQSLLPPRRAAAAAVQPQGSVQPSTHARLRGSEAPVALEYIILASGSMSCGRVGREGGWGQRSDEASPRRSGFAGAPAEV